MGVIKRWERREMIKHGGDETIKAIRNIWPDRHGSEKMVKDIRKTWRDKHGGDRKIKAR